MALSLTLAELIESYRGYLLVHQAGKPGSFALKLFDDRFAACSEAAQIEATTFEYLRSHNLRPRLLEDPAAGGVDFECRFGNIAFAVEATALRDDTITEKSGVDNDVLSARYFNTSAILSALRSRISKKAAQANTYPGPRVLAIGATHVASSMLFAVASAQLLTGESKIVVPVGPEGATGDSYMATELKNAAALQSTEDGIQTFRRKFALVLLVAVHGMGCHVEGVLHPDPEYPLDIAAFPEVPFARLQWPIIANTLRVEHIIARPRPERHAFGSIEFTNEELKSGIQ